jgi:hypothetical protein
MCLINKEPRHEEVWGSGVTAPPFLASALDGGEWLASRPDLSAPDEAAPGTYCTRGWVVPRTSKEILDRRNLLLLERIVPYLQPVVGPWPLLQFLGHFTQSVGLLGRGISPLQGRYLHTEQHKHRVKAHTDIHAWSGIRAHDPSDRASEDSSCLRPRGHCDRSSWNHGLSK